MMSMPREDSRHGRKDPTPNSMASSVIILLALCGCFGDAAPAREDDPRNEPAPSSLEQTQRTPSPIRQLLEVVVDSLALVQGEFRRQPSRPFAFEFAGNHEIFRDLRTFQADAVRSLIGCLDREDLATATVAGQRVRVGVMCYYALISFVYVEHTDASGGSEAKWAGNIDATADIEQLRMAKREWEALLNPPGYSMIPPPGEEIR